ncbi:uncharacterized protein LAESUDRAFT_728533 [Laetiporus sulphureus 93-53]|uniref:Uncharacterized protein n=1 Tax=Laetiporus sulphureus 93-53 TaxID=1314785 RepID=A0A165D2R2_9APHY|nr:uncharacterized protein LAESUDRAFT_728533 [Laetiporus sulphureus 93-53]KZT04042.1 hypothetical protein LAESUDRAFT_728533 [Laetiporus sulphureus 93-53]
MDTTPGNINSEPSSPLTVPTSEHSDLTVPEISIIQPLEGSQLTPSPSDPQILNMPAQLSNPSSSIAVGPSGLLLTEAVQFIAKFRSGFSVALLRACVMLKNTSAGKLLHNIIKLVLNDSMENEEALQLHHTSLNSSTLITGIDADLSQIQGNISDFFALVLEHLSQELLRCYDKSHLLSELKKAIAVQQRAVQLTPDDHAHKSGQLSNLGNSFLSRFEHVGNLADVDQAIAV